MMLIKVGFDIAYEVWAPTPMVLLLHVHPSRQRDIRQREELRVDPHVPEQEFFDPFGTLCARLAVPPGVVRCRCDAIVADTGQPDPIVADAIQHPIEEL